MKLFIQMSLRVAVVIERLKWKFTVLFIFTYFEMVYGAVQSPGIKKDKLWEQNLQTLLRGRNSVGFPEIAKILSPEFSQGAINIKDTNTDSSADNTKGKGQQKKGKKK